MDKDNLVKFLNKHFNIMFEGLPWVVGIAVGLMGLGALVLFICVAPYVVCVIIGFYVLCYIVGFIREKVSQGFFDHSLSWCVRHVKDKIKKWRVDILPKSKSAVISYLKPIKDLRSLAQKYWK